MTNKARVEGGRDPSAEECIQTGSDRKSPNTDQDGLMFARVSQIGDEAALLLPREYESYPYGLQWVVHDLHYQLCSCYMPALCLLYLPCP